LEGVGVETNYQMAVELLQKAAKQEHAMSQHLLSWCYYYGIGVEQNREKAVDLYDQSVGQGIVVERENTDE